LLNSVAPDYIAIFTNHFTGRGRLHIVEDSAMHVKIISHRFAAPFFTIEISRNFAQLKQKAATQKLFHCWICDIDLGSAQSGLDILTRSYSPFTLMVSGLQTMEIAAQAMKKGAVAVFDKSPASIDRLYDEVCALMPISFLFKGRAKDNLALFLLLKDHQIQTIHQWAELAGVSERQLNNLCRSVVGISPKKIIPFYHCLYTTLMEDSGVEHSYRYRWYHSKGAYLKSCYEYVLERFSSHYADALFT